MNAKMMLIALTLLSGSTAIAQKIKSDDTDKKTKIRTIETTDEKISDLKISPLESSSWEDTKAISASIFAINSTKFLKLYWINTSQLVNADIDSVYFIGKEDKKEKLTVAQFSALGRKLSMTSQMNAAKYSNILFLSGSISSKISKVIIVLKNKSKLEAILNPDETKFIYQANLLVSNIVG